MRTRTSSEANITVPAHRTSISVSYDTEDKETLPLLPGNKSAGHVSWGAEITETWSLAWPVIITYLLQIFPGMMNVVFLGHLGVAELGASTLGTMYINVTGLSVGLGLATAMDTLCSQAYGANNKKLLGVILQRGMLILGFISIPVAFVWWFAEPILLACHQPEEVARLSGLFIKLSLPGLYPLFLYELMKKYLQTQGIVKPSMYIAAISNVYNVFVNWLFIYGFNWGFVGAPLARASCNWLMVFITYGYVRWSGVYKDTWGGFTRDAWKNWGQFMNLAVPGMLMTCSEWWAFEVLTIAAGILGTIELNAQSVILQVIVFSYMTPLGVAVSSTIRVGKFLGNGQADAAKHGAKAAIMLILIIQIFTSILTIVFRYNIPKIYTTNQEAINLAAAVIPIVSGFQLFDGVQGVCSGVLRGCGRQKVGAMLNTVCYYFVGIPIGLFFAFTLGLELPGIWWGMFIGLGCVSTAAVVIVLRTDWDAQCIQAAERIHSNNQTSTTSGH
eukprot:Nk52_evm2s564 gene=Nk52_evmTU2s564